MSNTPEVVIDYFHRQTLVKDPGAAVVNHLDDFVEGIAPYESGKQPVFDGLAESLAPNFREDIVLENGIIIPAISSSANRTFNDKFHEQRDKKPIVVIAPHPSIASPFVVARALNLPSDETIPFDENIAKRMYSVVGPRPMTYDYTTPVGTISPFELGIMLNNLLLTGTNTASVDDAPEAVAEWLKNQGEVMKNNLDELMEPKEQGDNNILIVCPSGKIGEQGGEKVKEFLPRSYKFAASVADRAVFWPMGVFDKVLVNPEDPSSLVFFNPDGVAHAADLGDENDIYTFHLRAIELAGSAVGAIKMQSRLDAMGKHFARKVRSFTKK